MLQLIQTQNLGKLKLIALACVIGSAVYAYWTSHQSEALDVAYLSHQLDQKNYQKFCAHINHIQFPRGDQPTSTEMRALRDESEDEVDLFYGLSQEPDYHRARLHAYKTIHIDFSIYYQSMGAHVLSMIYANGLGVKQDFRYAMKALCSLKPYNYEEYHYEFELFLGGHQDPTTWVSYDWVNHDFVDAMGTRLSNNIEHKRARWKNMRALDLKLKDASHHCSPTHDDYVKNKGLISTFLYQYKVLSPHKIFLHRGEQGFTLDVEDIANRVAEMRHKPSHFVYINQYKHKILFPFANPEVTFQGSMRVMYLQDSFFVLDGHTFDEYVPPVTYKNGRFLPLWLVNEMKFGSCLMIMDLAEGTFDLISESEEALTFPDGFGKPGVEPFKQEGFLKLDIGSRNTDIMFFESDLPSGFQIQIHKSQETFPIYDPLYKKVTYCRKQ